MSELISLNHVMISVVTRLTIQDVLYVDPDVDGILEYIPLRYGIGIYG